MIHRWFDVWFDGVKSARGGLATASCGKCPLSLVADSEREILV